MIIIALLVLAVSTGCDQKTSDKKEVAESPMTKKSSKTADHVQIPGSQLYIIPPAGFTEDKITTQLVKGYANFEMVKIIVGYTTEKYLAELKVVADKKFPGTWKQDDIIADGHKAIICQYKQPGAMQYYLAFTDGYTDDMLLANFEDNDAATGKEIYAAMKTVIVEK